MSARFIEQSREGTTLLNAGQKIVFVDRETGVNYLYVTGGGVTPLYNADGTLVVTK